MDVTNMGVLRITSLPAVPGTGSSVSLNVERPILADVSFQRILAYERSRSERSHKPFLLMLLEFSNSHTAEKRSDDLMGIMSALALRVRETDVVGWYHQDSIAGVLFTEISSDERGQLLSVILNRLSQVLQADRNAFDPSTLRVSFHFFPDDWKEGSPVGGSNDAILYPDLLATTKAKHIALGIKRFVDILVSLALLTLISPLVILIGLAIKATSRGPILFKQHRVGQYGRHFLFFKFRSMCVNNDCAVHREYVHRLISGTASRMTTKSGGEGVYKLADDTRVTPLGRFLRRTSLDELPQLLNVLRGDMSLVGPRPPIPYELGSYEIWHRRRLMQVKPGITGLWQVTGRSRVSFDEMVRLDIRYAETWSLWGDFKILVRTPAAILRGAY